MNDHEFKQVKAAIDMDIDSLGSRPAGIRMSFSLAGQFLKRELLTNEEVDMILFKWEMRAYRGRYVYPDPMMADYQYALGGSSI